MSNTFIVVGHADGDDSQRGTFDCDTRKEAATAFKAAVCAANGYDDTDVEIWIDAMFEIQGTVAVKDVSHER